MIICRHLTPSYCAATAFIVTPPLTSSMRRHSLHRRPASSVSVFIVAPPLPSLSRKRCLPCGAAAPFIVAPPLPSSSPTLIVAWFCLRRRAAAASLLIVAPPLPSLSCRWFCFCRCTTAAFLEAMSAVDDCCVTPKFAMIFLSAVTVKLWPFLPARVPPHASNSSPASPASATQIWMIVE